MAVDTRPFPKNVRVGVRNDNKDLHIQIQYDGELYDFPPGDPQVISPEAAYHIFLFDTRTELDRYGNDTEKPRNYRDTMSTGAIGNTGLGQQTTLYMQRLLSLGWANSQEKRQQYEHFTIKPIQMNAVIDKEAFKKLLLAPA